MINLDRTDRPDSNYIRGMFDGMARRYDMFTILTGFGQAQRWRQMTLKDVSEGMRVLDLGCGTGDLSLLSARKVRTSGQVFGLDFSSNMLDVARYRYDALKKADPAIGSFQGVLAKAEDLPLNTRPFDFVVSGFVLRNLYENIDRILKGVFDSLKPGGSIRFLDLTEPEPVLFKKLFRFYMMTAVGLYGALLFGKKYPIPYLPDSAQRFASPAEFQEALKRAGFRNISAKPLMLGSVTLYQADKAG